MGMRLREAREAREINPRALETELRTTYRHLLALEEGQTRLFYSDSFYRDLFTRYALCLGFSAEEARVMVERLYEPIPPLGQAQATGTVMGATTTLPKSPADSSLATAPQDAVVASGTDTPASARTDAPGSVASPEAQATHEVPPSGQASLSLDLPVASSPPPSVAASQVPASMKTGAEDSPGPTSQRSSSRLDSAPTAPSRSAARPSNTGLFVIILAGLITFVWVITRAPEPEAPPSLANPASQSPSVPAPAAPSGNAAVDTPAPAASPANSPSSVAPAPTGTPPSAATPATAPQTPAPAAGSPAKSSVPATAPGPTSTPTQAPPSPPSPSPAQSPTTPSAPPVVPAAPAPEGAAPKVPELELTFRTKGWVWVRESNDQVREFVVQEGGTVRFQEVPIFIVLPAPDQIDAKVLGRPVSLKRTEDEKNHGRFTRTMLRQAANLGRPTASNAN